MQDRFESTSVRTGKLRLPRFAEGRWGHDQNLGEISAKFIPSCLIFVFFFSKYFVSGLCCNQNVDFLLLLKGQEKKRKLDGAVGHRSDSGFLCMLLELCTVCTRNEAPHGGLALRLEVSSGGKPGVVLYTLYFIVLEGMRKSHPTLLTR